MIKLLEASAIVVVTFGELAFLVMPAVVGVRASLVAKVTAK